MKKTLQTKMTSTSTFFSLVGISLLAIFLTNYPPSNMANVALGKRATQSSDYSSRAGKAMNAVDGNTNGDWFAGSVTHTKGGNGEHNPWWSVDLGEVYEIGKIQIWNRMDCCQERLDNTRILFKEGPKDSWSVFTKQNHRYRKGETYPLTFNTQGKQYARYIMVQRMAGNAILSLAEVKVFGKPLKQLPSADDDPTISLTVKHKEAISLGKPRECTSNSFKDPINGGTCWVCPDGYKRTVFSVTSNKACELPAGERFAYAKRHERGKGLLGTDCDGGQFYDLNGYCYSCPKGYNRTAYHVNSEKACSQRVHADYRKAEEVGRYGCDKGFYDVSTNKCWTCPKGYKRTVYSVKGSKACEKIKIK